MASMAAFTLLRLFPNDDPEFEARADAALRVVGERAGPAELERVLVERYPSVRVRLQERLAMNGDIRPHWYVFRDGRVATQGASDRHGDGRGARRPASRPATSSPEPDRGARWTADYGALQADMALYDPFRPIQQVPPSARRVHR